MINNIALFFTKELLFSYEPIHLMLGTSIGTIVVVILIKKITIRKNKK